MATGWDRLYGTERWRRVSKLQLQRVPCCERCTSRGQTIPATLSHHTREYRPGDGVLEFYSIPLMSLCDDCHREIHHIGARKPFITTIGEDGWPVDPLNPVYQTVRERNGKKL